MVRFIFGIIPIFSFLNKSFRLLVDTTLFRETVSVYHSAVVFITRGATISVFNDARTLLFTLIVLLILGGFVNIRKVYSLLKIKAGFYAIVGEFWWSNCFRTISIIWTCTILNSLYRLAWWSQLIF